MDLVMLGVAGERGQGSETGVAAMDVIAVERLEG
jgi:hypothetical protein